MIKVPRYGRICGRLRELGFCQGDLAYALHLSGGAISKRMHGTTEWSVAEMYQAMDFLRAPAEELHLYFPPQAARRRAG